MLKAVFLIMFPICVQASGINFYEGTWEEVVNLAKKQDKIIFLDAYAEWCGPCKLMSAKVFTDLEVGAYYNQTFINVKIDMEKGEGLNLRSMYQVTAYPTLLFINPNGEVVQKKIGAIDANNFLLLGKSAFRNYDKSDLYKEKYDEGNRKEDFLLKYVKSLTKVDKSPIKVANDFISQHNGGPYSETALLIILESAVEVDSKVFDEFLLHYKEIQKIAGKEDVKDQILLASINTARKAREYNVDFLGKQVKKIVKKYLDGDRKKNPELNSLLYN